MDGFSGNTESLVLSPDISFLGRLRRAIRTLFQSFTHLLGKFFQFLKTTEAQNVIKCSIAYFLASMLVYSPIREIFGKSQNKHMAATVAVYFHPARTAGSMYEAIIFVCIALLYSLLMVASSLVLSRVFLVYDMRYTAYMIDILFFCGFGLGFIAFIKQRINKPTFNTACSVAAIFLVTTLTKEGNVQAGIIAFDKMMQTFMLVSSGVAISAIISFTLWPKSALVSAKKEMTNAMKLNAGILRHLTTKFMDCESIQSSEFSEMKAKVSSSHKKLAQSVNDAAYELRIRGRESEYDTLVKLVQSSHKLTLLLNGLSSSVMTQSALLAEESELQGSESNSIASGKLLPSSSSIKSIKSITLLSLNRPKIIDDGSIPKAFNGQNMLRSDSVSSNGAEGSATALFNQFINSIRSTMTEYFLLIDEIMNELPFNTKAPYETVLHPHHVNELKSIIQKYSDARESCLFEIYKQESFIHEKDFDKIANKEAEAASCGNFSYILEEIGNELMEYIKILDEYQMVEKEHHLPWSHNWIWKLSLSKFSKPSNSSVFVDVTRHELYRKWERKHLQREETSEYLKLSGRSPKLTLRIWRSLRAFRGPDVQFAIKVGLGAAIFAIPAFVDSMRPKFTEWRGEWGLITFFIIMSKSVGGTANTVPIRVSGTFLGAFFAYCFWTLFPENNIVLPLVGAALSFICFWIILTWPSKNAFGRFILLTFNLTVLYSYSISVQDDDDDEDLTKLIVMDIAFHRFIMVCCGVIWALFISTFVLPNSARRKLKRGLSILWMQMGLVWKADALKMQPRKQNIMPLPLITSGQPIREEIQADGTVQMIRQGTELSMTAQDNNFVGIQGETAMQMTMIELNELLSNAPNELRLKGPFPADEYEVLLKNTQQILDIFQDMSVLIAKDPKASSRELEIIEYTTMERTELCNRIFLNFYLLSSAMRLGFPLPDKMPSTEHAIDRMLAKLNDYRAASIKSDVNDHNAANDYVDPGYVEDFILFYSYILATIAITERLAELTIYIQNIFGVIEEEMFDV